MGGVKRFINASSSSVYGDATELPLHEDVPLHPYSPYGVTKLAAEHLCTLYQHNFGIPTVSLRYFTVYGPRQRPDMAFHRFCKAIIFGEPIRVYDDGTQTRDFTYISDVVEANIQAAHADNAVGQAINIAGGSRVTVRDVIHILENISGTDLKVIYEAQTTWRCTPYLRRYQSSAKIARLSSYHPANGRTGTRIRSTTQPVSSTIASIKHLRCPYDFLLSQGHLT